MTRTVSIGPALPARMDGVREYAESLPVELLTDPENGRLVIRAFNEGGHNVTHVDLIDLLDWLALHSDALGGIAIR